MSELKKHITRALKPDAQGFDEVRIVTVPRYKTSGLSGNEWRISARIELWRKGKKVAERYAGNIAYAVQFLPAFFLTSIDEGLGHFAGEEDLCDQEGCAEKANVTYRLKKEYSRDNPHTWNQEPPFSTLIRKFCQRHSTRGDCGFEDSDQNYELIEGIPLTPEHADESPSSFGGVINP